MVEVFIFNRTVNLMKPIRVAESRRRRQYQIDQGNYCDSPASRNLLLCLGLLGTFCSNNPVPCAVDTIGIKSQKVKIELRR